jgi:hypothetical protein
MSDTEPEPEPPAEPEPPPQQPPPEPLIPKEPGYETRSAEGARRGDIERMRRRPHHPQTRRRNRRPIEPPRPLRNAQQRPIESVHRTPPKVLTQHPDRNDDRRRFQRLVLCMTMQPYAPGGTGGRESANPEDTPPSFSRNKRVGGTRAEKPGGRVGRAPRPPRRGGHAGAARPGFLTVAREVRESR